MTQTSNHLEKESDIKTQTLTLKKMQTLTTLDYLTREEPLKPRHQLGL